MKAGSMFTGIGGFDLGFQRAGMEPAWMIERDDYCQQVLSRRWPSTTLHHDVATVDPGELAKVDLISGGFPCQDLSVAGNRAGLEGDRSGLFWEVVRVAKGLRPRWLVLENVPGLLSSNKGADFATVLEALGELGYGLGWRVLDSQYFGLAQRRKRVFIVGHLGGPCPPEVLFEREGSAGDPGSIQAKREVTSALTASSPGRGGADVAHAQARHIVPTHRTNNRNNSNPMTEVKMLVFDKAQITSKDNRSKVEPGSPAPTLGRKTEIFCAPVAPTLFASGAGTARVASAGSEADFLVANTLTSHAGRHDPGVENYVVDVAATLTSGGKGRPGRRQEDDINLVGDRGAGVRRLTPVECERLQGFPDGWTEDLSDTRRYMALGNAVSVPVAEWIGRRIMAVEQ